MDKLVPLFQTVPFDAPYADDDDIIVNTHLAARWCNELDRKAVAARASNLIQNIRDNASGIGGLEDFLRDYGLSTKEGLALMVMAEALLRVPDAATQGALIEEKIGTGHWSDQPTHSADTWFVSAATWGLGLSNRIITLSENPDSILGTLAQRLGKPAMRIGVRQAMAYLGHQFVLGQTIGEALKRAGSNEASGYLHSYDMLGEGARTWEAARAYKQSYADAIEAIGRSAQGNAPQSRPGISVKLSALHPKYNARNTPAVLRELVPDLIDLARMAAEHNLNFTVDAEEADRLELSLKVIAAAFADPKLRGWTGYGLAIQAYQKRALAVIDWANEIAKAQNSSMMVRLVKGAYWDSEIKQAQLDGLDDFPVFTRKAATDLNYLACAARLLDIRDNLFAQFATHNAMTVAAIQEMAGDRNGYEFQRLHGMGEDLYDQFAGEDDAAKCRIYAPVGSHEDLLAYLVRRLLENGANSSFVAKVADKSVPVADLLEHPSQSLKRGARHPKIDLPSALFGSRKNSEGFNFGSDKDLAGLTDAIASQPKVRKINPISAAGAKRLMDKAYKAFPYWNATPVDERAAILERAADLLEADRDAAMAILAREAGKTQDDGISEIREAVDFLRYYAAEARSLFVDEECPGPVGERNLRQLCGRGPFICISPWNFPLAIFLGQVSAALAAGNSVVAKPAPQTPAIARLAIDLLHKAGVPKGAVALAPGGVDVGEALIGHPAVAGVVFTGSTAVAKTINRQLAKKDGPIVPLIAETGGVNAMVVDATALPEQVCDDVISSAFRSAGQRCSALRLLYLQDDIYDDVLDLISKATDTLVLGDSADPATDIGPIIDQAALDRLQDYLTANESRIVYHGKVPQEGTFLAPHILELGPNDVLDREIFGPVLHVKRWKSGTIDGVMREINSTGFGLTFGVHSRIRGFTDTCVSKCRAGNAYVNRDTIGAIVGSQPFGGAGLSGTGPKAGGPLYLTRFVTERVVSTDTTAAGGNASLIAMDDGY